MRIGHGFDVHRYIKDAPMILGGVSIDYELGIEAHSDGDVVIHALCDAILGAAALGDIGTHFPDTDQQWKNADSRKFLRHIIELMQTKNYRLHNADITIVAQAPKILPHKAAMLENLIADIGCDTNAINIKATTTEKMGYIGRKEGIAVHAVVCLEEVVDL